MSAATEYLMEQIRDIEGQIKTAQTNGQDTAQLKLNLDFLQKRLAQQAGALTEGKQILKG